MSTSGTPKPLNDRAQYLFKCLVERYLADGQPVGSRTLARDARLELSPATIRNVMADLEDLGLIQSPHTSAGRIPTVRGYRMFVDSMIAYREPAQDEVQFLTRNLGSEEDVRRLLTTTSDALSKVTRLAGLVMLPLAEQRSLRHIEFLPLNDNRVLAILVFNDREVQNRVIQTARNFSQDELIKAANYLNAAFQGKDIRQVKEDLLRELRRAHDDMNATMEAVIAMAQTALETTSTTPDYVVAGQTNLMDVSELSNVERLRALFEAFNNKQDILQLLDQALNATGVQIFIGEESGYQALEQCSVVTSTYHDENNKVIGVLGVIGPTRMEYERVVPIVSLTARMLSTALKSFN